MRRLAPPLAYLAFVGLLSVLFAQVEIQVEGPAGWAANLPTWKVTPREWPILEVVWAGRPLTGYHFYVFAFMALVFHLPVAFGGRWGLTIEARCLGSIMVFWIVEDVLWFVMNPAFHMKDFKEGSVSWHPHWFLGLPADYWMFGAGGLALLLFSFRRELLGRGPPPRPDGEGSRPSPAAPERLPSPSDGAGRRKEEA